MKTAKLFFLSLMIVSFAFTACSDSDEGGNNGPGTLSIKMTDAPFPHDMVSEANVTITRIDVRHKGDGDSEEVDSLEGDSLELEDDTRFITVSESEVTLNLLDLTNGITETLANTEVPEGSYDLVRLFVSEASIVLTDGTTFNVEVPSGSQTGIKVFIKPSIVVTGGSTTDLLLDFDVSRSFVLQGNVNTPAGIRGFIFKPVIKATNISSNSVASGTLTGLVTTVVNDTTAVDTTAVNTVALEGVQISVIAADTLNNTSTFTDAEGKYTVLGLAPGSYLVRAEMAGFIAKEEENVSIVGGSETTVNFELLPDN